MLYHIDRNYDPETEEKGTEAITFFFPFGRSLTIRWYSAQDGRTPMLSLSWHVRHKVFAGWSWTIIPPKE